MLLKVENFAKDNVNNVVNNVECGQAFIVKNLKLYKQHCEQCLKQWEIWPNFVVKSLDFCKQQGEQWFEQCGI